MNTPVAAERTCLGRPLVPRMTEIAGLGALVALLANDRLKMYKAIDSYDATSSCGLADRARLLRLP